MSFLLKRRSPQTSPDAPERPGPSSPKAMPPKFPEGAFPAHHGLSAAHPSPATLTASPLHMPGAYRPGSPSRLPGVGPLTAPSPAVNPASPLFMPGSYPMTPDAASHSSARPSSPVASYFSAPSPSPLRDAAPALGSIAPLLSPLSVTSPLHESPASPGGPLASDVPSHHEEPDPELTQESFPTTELVHTPAGYEMFEDEGLSTLEKIYLFSRSQAAFHRAFIVHALPEFLKDVKPVEAVDYVLPLFPDLARDEDDAVKDALANELVSIVWWFVRHCQVIDYEPPEGQDNPALLFVQAFTPIFGTLLLSPNAAVVMSAQRAVVDLLTRIHEAGSSEESLGLFLEDERTLLQHELIENVVIGMGQLDEEGGSSAKTSPAAVNEAESNPYFPAVATTMPAVGESSSAPPLDSASPSHPPELSPSSGDSPAPSPEIASPARRDEAEPGIYIRLADESDEESPNRGSPMSLSEASSSPSLTKNGTPEVQVTFSEDTEGENEAGTQAAMGRLSSMSLIAAVTANGSAGTTVGSFVPEVLRAGRDQVHWVRREASFALGALAKVVPHEVALTYLLPLFQALSKDPVWHVRHSALFAFPAILSRLSPSQRHYLAMDVVLPLSVDPAPAVQTGVLEALGEVIHSFRDDPGGPPNDILRFFLGRPEDRRFWEDRIHNLSPSAIRPPDSSMSQSPAERTAFFDDPSRPLICAFNYPAVTLTLGPNRWNELRDVYLELSTSEVVKVRKTLAASAGEIAKVIGPKQAAQDVLPMWFAAARDEEPELRLKAMECLETLVQALAPAERGDVLVSLQRLWADLRGWREREAVSKSLDGLVPLMGDKPGTLRALLSKALQDPVAAVRQAAVAVVPKFCAAFSNRPDVIRDTYEDINRLGRSPSYRHRMTFVACRQALVVAPGGEATLGDANFWKLINALADDGVVNVRIGVARLAGIICDKFFTTPSSMPSHFQDIVVRISHDQSKEVQSYVSLPWDRPRDPVPTDLATFSRPPPAPAIPSPTSG